MKNFIHYLQYFAVRFISFVLGIMPNSVVYSFAKALGLFVYHILRIRRKVSMENLSLALDLSQEELTSICRNSYINIGMTMIEMLVIPHLKKNIQSMVDLPDLEILRKNLLLKRGIILVGAHFGSWEVPGAAIANAGFPIAGIGARQSNPYLDSYIKNSRTQLGMEVIDKHQSAFKSLVKALRNRQMIGLVSDQDAGQEGVFVNFFGRPSSTPTGAAQLALRYKSPMLMVLAIRTRPGHYQLLCEEVEMHDDDTVETLTQRYTKMLEDVIRQHPEQYFWMHRRWKTRKVEGLKAED